jgi:dTDP-glucose 4,6-dehydratase
MLTGYPMNMRKILVTGGAGFIGSNLVHHLQTNSVMNSETLEITVLDALTYAGNVDNLSNLPNPQMMKFVHGDVRDWDLVQRIVQESDEIFHLAAESHVDRSITNPGIFIETNVQGTLNILEASRKFSKRVLLVSTDEVYGSLTTGFADEDYPLNPSSPYSASKASADLLAISFHKTFGLDVVITRCSNNYGPRQYPEKLIPQSINKILRGEKIPVYGNGQNVRDWIHVEDHCSGLLLAMNKGKSGRIYNFGDIDKLTNIEVITQILSIMSTSSNLIEYVEDRLGHDYRYAINASRAKNELGWQPKKNLSNSLSEIVDWYRKKL